MNNVLEQTLSAIRAYQKAGLKIGTIYFYDNLADNKDAVQANIKNITWLDDCLIITTSSYQPGVTGHVVLPYERIAKISFNTAE